MKPSGAPQGANDERLAGGLLNVVLQLQKNRFGGVRELQGSPIGGEQNAAPAPGAFQDEERQEPGRQRNVGQGQAQSGFGQSTAVPR